MRHKYKVIDSAGKKHKVNADFIHYSADGKVCLCRENKDGFLPDDIACFFYPASIIFELPESSAGADK